MIADLTISDMTGLITAIVTGLLGVIGAIVTGVVTIRNGQKAADKQREYNQTSNDKKLGEIHELTNSNLSKINAALTTAMEKISGLERRLEDRDTKINEQNVELAKLHAPSQAKLGAAPEPIEVLVIPDKPVPVTLEKSRPAK